MSFANQAAAASQVFVVLMAPRPSGLRPWKVLWPDRTEVADLPRGLITHLERLYGPVDRHDPPPDARIEERYVVWPPPE